jgi:hypothetical protein
MFDWLDPAGSLANKYLDVPKTGVTTSDNPKNIGEMITNRIPGARGGSTFQDAMNMNTGKGETEEDRKKKLNTQGVYKAGGKVKSASARADGCCIRGKTRA